MTPSNPLVRLGCIFFIWAALFFFGHSGVRASSDDNPARLSDAEFLEHVARRTFDYFRNEKNQATGLVYDRAPNFQANGRPAVASIAATGFGLTVYGVAAERGWVDKAQAHEYARRTLEFALGHVAHERGFFYHYVDSRTGAKVKGSEVSPIDTALFLAGALFAAEYFQDDAMKETVRKIYERVDFAWMLHGGRTLAMSWKPEEGFNKRRWDHYDESVLLYILAMGSPSHPIDPAAWREVLRPVGSYKGHRLILMPPLFTHQYPQVWLDLRDKNDGIADYFKNSVSATLANRAFAADQASRFAGYGPDAWGLTATDGPFGYRAYGAPPGWAEHDGTLSPAACGTSVVFTPAESVACMRHVAGEYGGQIWGRYGFSSAFNIDKKWFSQDVIAIDAGALILMIENSRTGLVWETMNRVEAVREGMRQAGFKEGSLELAWPDPPVYEAGYAGAGIRVDGYLNDWPRAADIVLDRSFRENGDADDDKDLRAEFRFAWNEAALFFVAKISDQDLTLKRTAAAIWRDDLVEIFIDPEGDGFFWTEKKDFQIGFRARREDDFVQTWSWFQSAGDPSEKGGGVEARGYVHQSGYVIEGAIRWSYLGLAPKPGGKVRLSFGVHDADRNRTEAKLQWFFRNEVSERRFELGNILLSGPTGKQETSPKPEG